MAGTNASIAAVLARVCTHPTKERFSFNIAVLLS
jgi:hypothetical protein